VNIPFIDIHTHHPVNSEEIQSVPSLFLQDVDLQIHKNTLFSAAIHPWHASGFAPGQVSAMLENLVKLPGLIAIGETGLDKVCHADFQDQTLIFELHLRFAEKNHKPLIIHAVKSWNELIVYLKRAKVPFIFHGYSGGIELTKQLIDQGAYFSVGKSALHMTPRFGEAIQIIPLSSLFLETDDSLSDIREIYHEVSKTRGISLDELKNQINKNFKHLFFNTSA
jgi:TatD DNase family protein